MNQRHTEFFGADLARGPFPPHRIETAAIQIATALAQLRTPLLRDDEALRAHADFIRELADRLAPDWAAQVRLDVGSLQAGTIPTSILAATGTFSLLECWLADEVGGGVTAYAPAAVTWAGAAVLETLAANKHYRIITPHTGAVSVEVTYSGPRSWYWAVCRQGRVYYSSQLDFG